MCRKRQMICLHDYVKIFKDRSTLFACDMKYRYITNQYNVLYTSHLHTAYNILYILCFLVRDFISAVEDISSICLKRHVNI